MHQKLQAVLSERDGLQDQLRQLRSGQSKTQAETLGLRQQMECLQQELRACQSERMILIAKAEASRLDGAIATAMSGRKTAAQGSPYVMQPAPTIRAVGASGYQGQHLSPSMGLERGPFHMAPTPAARPDGLTADGLTSAGPEPPLVQRSTHEASGRPRHSVRSLPGDAASATAALASTPVAVRAPTWSASELIDMLEHSPLGAMRTPML